MKAHSEPHLIHRIGWLRAAVLGANDGIISTASLMVGVASAAATRSDILLAGLAGLSAGAMSMAAGEYVSVQSQADAELADLARESKELASDRPAEENELTDIYIKRGLAADLARQVAVQLMAKDALGAHARDELGISEFTAARPLLAAFASAVSFAAGGVVPVLVALLSPVQYLAIAVSGASLLLLALLGATGAAAGGAPVLPGAGRVAFWGAVAMLFTALIGNLIGARL